MQSCSDLKIWNMYRKIFHLFQVSSCPNMKVDWVISLRGFTGVAALSFQAVDQWDAWTWNKRGNENKENGIDSILWGYKENGIGLIMK